MSPVPSPRSTDQPAGGPLYRRWHTVDEVAVMLGYGRSKTKRLIASGAIRSVKDGGHRRVLPEWVDEYIRDTVERHDTGALR